MRNFYSRKIVCFISVIILPQLIVQGAPVDFLQHTLENVKSHYEGLCTEVLITNNNFYDKSQSDLYTLARKYWEDNYLREHIYNPKVILLNDHPVMSKPPVYRAPKDYLPYLLSLPKSTKRYTPSCVINFVLDVGVFREPELNPGLIIFSKSTWPLKTPTDHFIFLIGKAEEDHHKNFLNGNFGQKIREKISYSLELSEAKTALQRPLGERINSTHLYSFPVEFMWKEIHRTFFTLERNALNLNGKHLRAAILKPPQSLLESTTKNGVRTGRGTYYEYILNIEETFNCTLEYFVSYSTGSFSKVNGTWRWIGAIGDTLANNYDMTLINAMTEERLQVVDVSVPIQKQYMTFRVMIPSYSISWFAAVKPLGKTVWYWVLITLVCFSLIFITLKYIRHVHSVTVLDIFLDIFKLMLSQGIELLPKLGYGLVGLALIFSMLISTCYNSKLVGFLTFPVVTYPENLRELNSSDEYTVYGVNYGSLGGRTLRDLYGGIRNRIIYVNQFECIKNMLADQKSVCIDYDNSNMYRWNSNFTLSSAHDFSAKVYSFTQSPICIDVGVTFPKDWIYSHEFIDHVEILFETGFLDFWKNRDARKVRQVGINYLKSVKSERMQYLKQLLINLYESDRTTLKMHHIIGILTGWIILVAISSLLFLFEHFAFAIKLYHYKKRKNGKPKRSKKSTLLLKSTRSVIVKNKNILQIVDEQCYPPLKEV